MCGIFGAWVSSPEKRSDAIAHLQHRGPDDSGVFVDEKSGVCLGHTRLSILDVSRLGHQPMESADGRVVIAFNGEIYNFMELKSELEGKGYQFKSRSDTEVLLNVYHHFGDQMLEKLNGIFAFVIWDSQKEELFAARDGFGVKPLYFSETRDGIVFSSEIKSLQQLMPSIGGLDVSAVHRYLTFAWCPGGSVPVKSIKKLGPGEAVRVRNGRIERIWSWYELPVFRFASEKLGRNESVQGFLHYFRQSVKRQLVADVPVGAFLSGGLDSSAIVAMAREITPGIRCFTIDIAGGPDSGSQNDLPYAQMVANYLEVPLDVIRVDASQIASDIEKMVYMLDEPQADPASLNVLYISRLAREQGIKVLLSGVGGDDLFSGYRRHLAIGIEGAWTWLPGKLRKTVSSSLNSLDSRQHWVRRLKQFLVNATGDENNRMAGYFCQVREQEILPLYSDEFINELEDYRATQPILDFVDSIPRERTKLQKMLSLDQRFFLSDHNLNYTDKMSMAAGVEVRVPFLDKDLVEFSVRVPDRFKQHGFTSKWILREAMKPYLPHEIVRRSKTGFGLPVRRWLRQELREMLFDYLSSESIRKRGLFNDTVVQSLIKRNDVGEIDAAYLLFALLCTEIWCRLFLDGEADYHMAYRHSG